MLSPAGVDASEVPVPGPHETPTEARCVDSVQIRKSARAFEYQAHGSGRAFAPAAGPCGLLPWPPATAPGPAPEEESLARSGQRQRGARRTAPRKQQQQRRVSHRGDVVSALARNPRELKAAAQRGRVTPAVRTKFQAVALLLRDERARVRAAGSDNSRAEQQLKRLDGIATILATTAVRDSGLMALLAEDSDVPTATRTLKREMQRDLGIEPEPEVIAPVETATVAVTPERQVVPQSVVSRQLANPFLAPDFLAPPPG